MVQLEAMLCARPVVSTNLPTGVPWVNVHGETGLVVRPGDAASLRGAVARLMADPELCRMLGDAARDRVLTMFTADRMCAAAMALYRDVARKASSAPEEIAPRLASRSVEGGWR